MGLFGGGNSKSSSSTSVDIPTVTANQQGGNAPVVGGIYLSAEGGGKKSTTNSAQSLTVNITDQGAVRSAIGLAGDAAARAAAITSQSIAELGAERGQLVELVSLFGIQNQRLADLSSESQRVASESVGAVGAVSGEVSAVSAELETMQKWALWLGLGVAGYLAVKR